MELDFNKYLQLCINECRYRAVSLIGSDEPDIYGNYSYIKKLVDELKCYIPGIQDNLICMKYSEMPNDRDLIDDLRSLAKKIEIYLMHERGVSPMVSINNTVNPNINNTNNQTMNNNQNVNNTFDIKLELDKVRAEVDADEVLGEEDKEEINEKLNEIEEVMNGSSTNNEKWKKLKGVVNWVTTKGFKIGKMIMPIITKALFPEE